MFSGGGAAGATISGGTLEFKNGGTASRTIAFTGAGGTLQIDGMSLSGASISGFSKGNTIDLAGLSFATGGSAKLLSNNVLSVIESGLTETLQLDPTSSFAGLSFKLTNDGTGTDVSLGVTPTLTVNSNGSATRGQTLALSTLVTITDPDSVGYQRLELWDSNGTVGGGQFVINGGAERRPRDRRDADRCGGHGV